MPRSRVSAEDVVRGRGASLTRRNRSKMKRPKVESEPLKQLVGEGRNEKYVRECTELHLANQGIEEIHGFERLVSWPKRPPPGC